MSKHKSVWLLCLALMLEIIAIGVLVPGDWTGRVISKEKQMIQNQLGAQTSYWIGKTSHRWYQSWIVDTQMEQSVRDFLIPTEKQRLRSKGMENMGGFWFVWVEDRIQAFFDVLYQVFTRFALMMVWLPFALILMLPALWDGLMTWKIKKTFEPYHSPLQHDYPGLRRHFAVYGIVRPAGYSTGGVTVTDHRLGIDGRVGVKSLAEEDMRPRLMAPKTG